MFLPRLISRGKYGQKLLCRHFSGIVNTSPTLLLQLPKLEEPRAFILSSNLNTLKDLQNVIIAEDGSVQSVNAVNPEGEY